MADLDGNPVRTRFDRPQPMNLRAGAVTSGPARMLVAALAILGGCANAVFTEADDGEIKEVSRGAEFSISLPLIDSKPCPDPLIEGAFVRVVGRSIDEKNGRDIIQLKAEGGGDADIHIPAFRRTPESAAGEFVLRIRVKGGPDGSSGRSPQDHPKPQH